MNKVDRNLLLSGIVGIALSLVVIVYLNSNPNVLNFARRALPTPSSVATGPAVVTLSTSSLGGGMYGVEFTPVANKILSGFSLRLTLPYQSGDDISGVTFTPESSLMTQGWVFPVRQVSIDSTGKLIQIDISGVDTDPSGYNLRGRVEIGKINTSTLKGKTSLTFGVDRSQTKILAKDAMELNYSFSSL